MNKRYISLLAAAVLATGGAGAAAWAADKPKTDGAMHQREWKREDRPFSQPSERVEARLAYIRTALKITDAQKPQWDAYADAMRADARDADKRMADMRKKMEERWNARKDGKDAQRDDWQPPTAIERLEHERQFMSDELARLDARIAVEKPLYAALSPTQKQVADEVLGHGGHGGHGGMGHGGMGHGPMMGHEGPMGPGGPPMGAMGPGPGEQG